MSVGEWGRRGGRAGWAGLGWAPGGELGWKGTSGWGVLGQFWYYGGTLFDFEGMSLGIKSPKSRIFFFFFWCLHF